MDFWPGINDRPSYIEKMALGTEQLTQAKVGDFRLSINEPTVA